MHCCPLPQCRSQLAQEDIDVANACPEAWMHVTRQILGTCFQDAVVFCPRCEDRGMDIPVLMASVIINDAGNDRGVCRCKCFTCGLKFCGVCRSPCHPGEACFDDQSRVVRMAKRRPALPPDLQDVAVRIAEEVKKSEAQKAHDLAELMGNADFETIRHAFLDAHENAIDKGLESVFGPMVALHKAPVGEVVKKRFMQSFREMPHTCELRPAFHGTNAANHDSIFNRGLLIPGDQNELSVVHGAAHGRGVYTANIDAAWLSKGFCSHPVMLICGVIQSDFVRHVGDAMVVGKAEHVVPLFYGSADGFDEHGTGQRPISKVPIATQQTLPPKRSQTSPKAPPKEAKKEDKSSKFKARLERKSKRH